MTRLFSDTATLYAYLLNFQNLEKGQPFDLKLERMKALSALLGNPQDHCPSIHIAGSKGKGSIASMIAECLKEAGWRTGIYTSPHALDWTERIRLAGEPLAPQIILDAAADVFSVCESLESSNPELGAPTFFELCTLIAFVAFRRAGCARMVIETGLGGRLDSTNIISCPKATVITPIELEHQNILGNTLEKIAAEKAGIIQAPWCVASLQKPKVKKILTNIAIERSTQFVYAPDLFRILDVSCNQTGTFCELQKITAITSNTPGMEKIPNKLILKSSFIGKIYAQNMVTALAAISCAEPEATIDALLRGFAQAWLPLRFQIVGDNIVLDGAHTPNSVTEVLDTMESLFVGPKYLLFACASDKNHGLMAKQLAPRFEHIWLTAPGSFKESNLGKVEQSFKAQTKSYTAIQNFVEAIEISHRKSIKDNVPLLVTGSFYLCTEFLRRFPEYSRSW